MCLWSIELCQYEIVAQEGGFNSNPKLNIVILSAYHATRYFWRLSLLWARFEYLQQSVSSWNIEPFLDRATGFDGGEHHVATCPTVLVHSSRRPCLNRFLFQLRAYPVQMFMRSKPARFGSKQDAFCIWSTQDDVPALVQFIVSVTLQYFFRQFVKILFMLTLHLALDDSN